LLRKLFEASLIVETKLIFWNHPYLYLEYKCIFGNKKPRYWAGLNVFLVFYEVGGTISVIE